MSLDLLKPNDTARVATACADDWLTPRRFAPILAVCIFAAYPDVVLGMRTFFFRDFGYFGYPLAYYHQQNFWHGEIPLWNPLNNCGLPFLAQWNTLALYPGSLFYLLFPLAWSLGVFCLLHQFLAGLGMYFLAREWTGNRLAAAVAGMAFAFNGLTLNCLMWPNNIAALGWMPWVVLLVERAYRTGGSVLLAAAVAGAIQMLAGAPEIILFTWTISLAVLARQVASGQAGRGRVLGRFGLTVSLVAVFSAGQILPFLEFLAHSQRDTHFASSESSMPGTGWANFLVPLFHCFFAIHGVFLQQAQTWTSSYYPGVGIMVLACSAACHAGAPRIRLLAILAMLSAALALGEDGYLYKWLRALVPQFGFLRFPIKFVVITIFCLPLLAAQAVAWLQRGKDSSPVYWRFACASAAAITALIGLILWFAHEYPVRPYEWQVTSRNGLMRIFYSTLFLGCLWASGRFWRTTVSRVLPIALVFLLWLDIVTHAPRQNPTLQHGVFEPGLVRLSPAPAHGVSRAMISAEADRRFLTTEIADPYKNYVGTRLGLFSNCNLLDGIPKLDGFFSLYLEEANQVWAMLYVSGNTNLSPLLDFLNVSHITAPGKLFDWETRTNFLPFVTAGLRPVFADDMVALGSMAAPDFKPREVVYLPLEARSTVTAGQTSARILSSHFTAQRGTIDVEAEQRTLLVISQAYYRPWRAFVDGRPARLWRANYAFQAVETPAGPHRIEIVYRDPLFCLGVIVSVGALTACGATALALLRRTPPAAKTSAASGRAGGLEL